MANESGHYIEKCKHGMVLSQCRCPGPKTEYIVECNPELCPPAAMANESEADWLIESMQRWKDNDGGEEWAYQIIARALPFVRAARARVAELEKFKAAFPPVDDGEIARRMVSDRAVAEWKMWMRNEVLAARRYSKATIIRSVLHVCEPDAAMAEVPPTQAQRDGASEGD